MMEKLKAAILVIGAGPAGSLAARRIAAGGGDVLLVDKERFPREKICGEGLSGQTMRLLVGEGLADEVIREALKVVRVTFTSPEGRTVGAPRDDIYCLPRRILDHILVRAAVSSGARLREGIALREFRREGDRLIFAGTARDGGEAVEIECRLALIATGNPRSFREPARGGGDEYDLAVRAYCERYAPDEPPAMNIIFDIHTLPGYGWVFPSRDGRANVGAIIYSRQAPQLKIREVFDRFVETNPAVRRLTGGSPLLDGPQGAPIFTGFGRLPLVEGRLLRLGEAAGLGFPFTGEGIYSAMWSGQVAGDCVVEWLNGGEAPERLRAYERAMLKKFDWFFRGSRIVERLAKNPAIHNRTVRQASKHPELAALYAKILCEGYDFWETLHPKFILKSLF